MAKVWISDKCPVCKKPVEDGEDVILVSYVKVTRKETYASYKKRKRDVRPLFRSKQRGVYHKGCLEGSGFPLPE